ncbi:hypothetical protein HPB50_011644 [Hyalomma asiaticum]|uniref:Uncharacterized protein n=1 Tax=Hyalomma asiaticum TaxID=266040 RepID=A0ACB7SM44_HYAAI|nr:hypothetical protein HPB50_011644 [Hyalomma asiaticum]
MRARAAVVLNRRSVGAARAPCIIVLRALPSGSRAPRPSRDEERGEVRPPLSLSRFSVLVECTRTEHASSGGTRCTLERSRLRGGPDMIGVRRLRHSELPLRRAVENTTTNDTTPGSSAP